MKITKKWLKKVEVCGKGVVWFNDRKFKSDKDVFDQLFKDNQYEWASWTIVQLLNKTQRIQYAVYAAEQVLHIFEEKWPKDKRPREAIKAAKEALKKNNKKARAAAGEAAREAAREARAAREAAWEAAWAAGEAARAAAGEAARAAAGEARAAREAAWAAGEAAWAAAGEAARAAAGKAAREAMRKRIVEYGMKLVRIK